MNIKGHDSFGPWTMSVTGGHHGGYATCPSCGKSVHAVLTYYQCKLPMDIDVEKTLLKRVRRPIGVDCGCWSKFTRQVIHIAEGLLRRGTIPV